MRHSGRCHASSVGWITDGTVTAESVDVDSAAGSLGMAFFTDTAPYKFVGGFLTSPLHNGFSFGGRAHEGYNDIKG